MVLYVERVVRMMNEISNWLKKYKKHILAWSLYICYEAVIFGYISGVTWPFVSYLFQYCSIIIIFYFTAHVSLPWAIKGLNVFWRLPLVIVTTISIYAITAFFYNKLLVHQGILPPERKMEFTVLGMTFLVYRISLYLGFSSGYYYLRNYFTERERNAALEKQQLNSLIKEQQIEQELNRAQNAFLKAQINPHFLFNTLDFIYHNVNVSSPVAAEAIVNLAGMMRYALDSDKEGEFIELGDEIEQVEHLLHLYTLRKDYTLNVQFNYSDAEVGLKMIPLVLLTLVENMFKHGNLCDMEQPACIDLYLKEGYLNIETSNVVDHKTKKTSHFTGLLNVERRLKYAYGNDATLVYRKEGACFKVVLRIPEALLSAQEPAKKGLRVVA